MELFHLLIVFKDDQGSILPLSTTDITAAINNTKVFSYIPT